MGEVQTGDWLLGADGKPTRVVAATDAMEGRPCYEVEFDDGTVIVADAQHQWRTDSRAARRQRAETHTSCTGRIRRGVGCSAHGSPRSVSRTGP